VRRQRFLHAAGGQPVAGDIDDVAGAAHDVKSAHGRPASMTKKPTSVRYTLTEIKQQIAQGKDKTRTDAPEGPRENSKFWKRARIVVPPGKTSVHLRVDSDVFEWFKKQGDGHLTRMNAVLRSYVDAHRR